MNRIRNILLLMLAAVMVFLCIGCGEPEPETVSTPKAPSATETTEK